MKLQILGPGCARCKQLLANVQQAVADMGGAVEVEKVEDIKEIMKFRVLAAPALAVDGVVKAAGRVLSPDEIKKLLGR
ncbi:MAG TPA: thioredoxin family protein [Armatimonadota bacterium]|nr:thioredoxin family protein [Armatimonadota bacterium]